MSVEAHRKLAPRRVTVAVLTVSDSRTAANDASGDCLRRLLAEAGHPIADSRLVPDQPEQIAATLHAWIDSGDVQAILITGGTGLAPRDGTVEVVADLLDKRIEGFGELFRSLSFTEVGAAAMLSRAVAGVCRGVVVAAMPGSEAAVRLAMTRLILPELPHMVAVAGGS